MSVVTKPLNTVLIGLGMVADTHVNAIARLTGKVHLKGVFARGQEVHKTTPLKRNLYADTLVKFTHRYRQLQMMTRLILLLSLLHRMHGWSW